MKRKSDNPKRREKSESRLLLDSQRVRIDPMYLQRIYIIDEYDYI